MSDKQGFATRGAGGIIMEATTVLSEGRISPEDAGLWTDSQIAPLKRIVDFVHIQGPRLAFSSRMRVARLRHLPRGSSRARIASIVRIPRLPLLTRVDGLTTVRHSTFPTPIAAPVSRYFAVH
jgi:hypothetical protein